MAWTVAYARDRILKLPDSSQDAEVQMFMDLALTEAERYCQRKLLFGTETDTFVEIEDNVVALERTPVTGVRAIYSEASGIYWYPPQRAADPVYFGDVDLTAPVPAGPLMAPADGLVVRNVAPGAPDASWGISEPVVGYHEMIIWSGQAWQIYPQAGQPAPSGATPPGPNMPPLPGVPIAQPIVGVPPQMPDAAPYHYWWDDHGFLTTHWYRAHRWSLHSNTGLLHGPFRGARYLTISYDGGYNPIPVDLMFNVLWPLLRQYWAEHTGAAGGLIVQGTGEIKAVTLADVGRIEYDVGAKSVGGQTFDFALLDPSGRMQNTLDNYRRRYC